MSHLLEYHFPEMCWQLVLAERMAGIPIGVKMKPKQSPWGCSTPNPGGSMTNKYHLTHSVLLLTNLWHWRIAIWHVVVFWHSIWALLRLECWIMGHRIITMTERWRGGRFFFFLRENKPTWVEDHWAAAMAVLATEKALTRFPSGSKRSLKEEKKANYYTTF